MMNMSGVATGSLWNGLRPVRDKLVQPPVYECVDTEDILTSVVAITHIPRREILAHWRSDQQVKARFITYWLMRNYGMMSNSAIARELGKDPATVLKGVRRVETRPQDFEPWLSMVMTRLGIK